MDGGGSISGISSPHQTAHSYSFGCDSTQYSRRAFISAIALTGAGFLGTAGMICVARSMRTAPIHNEIELITLKSNVRFGETLTERVRLPMPKSDPSSELKFQCSCGCITVASAPNSPLNEVDVIVRATDALNPPQTVLTAKDEKHRREWAWTLTASTPSPFSGWPTTAYVTREESLLIIDIEPSYTKWISGIWFAGQKAQSSFQISTDSEENRAVLNRSIEQIYDDSSLEGSSLELVVEFGPDRVRWSGPVRFLGASRQSERGGK